MSEFRYLNPNRLQNIIAAIQVLGAWPWRGMSAMNWVKNLGDPLRDDEEVSDEDPDEEMKEKSIAAWRRIFLQHPEFFRLKGDTVSLRWRYGFAETYDPQIMKELSAEEAGQRKTELAEESGKPDRDRRNQATLQPRPLKSDETETLINTAIELHSRDIAQQQETRWKIHLFIPLVGGLIGSIIGAVLGALLGK